ncbi:N-acetyltransferase 6 [Poecilia latipinna]|uniref:N-acetyltransferase 6 n=1 Tax=Poecilia latipinna TaxID=48699 RepID=UPI00072DBE8A|nr:PREDICTED: N-acetyltransferase 6-like [Poecilia latipinna]
MGTRLPLRSKALTSSGRGNQWDVEPQNLPNSHYGEKVSLLDGDVQKSKHDDAEEAGRIHVVPIHGRPDLLVPCADLVNSEWRRSQAARVHSLQKSCSEFPVCLVLLQGPRGTEERLLGHARLTRVVGHGSSLFVESVVVSKQERGKGYGRVLMEETELYAKRRGFKRLCLTTHDKQHFYAHLGYVLSTPVQSKGAVMALLPTGMLMRLSRAPNAEANPSKQTPTRMEDVECTCVDGLPSPSNLQNPLSLSPPPRPLSSIPPPPPPPPCPLPSVPPPPPPTSLSSSVPPPSPPPPQFSGDPVIQTLTETPYRDARGVPIFWMHKDI